MADFEFTSAKQAQLEAARQKHLARSAHRAVDDPVALERGARLVRAALARKKLTLADLTPLPDPDELKRLAS